jgi:hypothetical protein
MIATQYVIWLTLLTDGVPTMSMPITSERFDSWITCSYYAIDAKNQMAMVLKSRVAPTYTVEWACNTVVVQKTPL